MVTDSEIKSVQNATQQSDAVEQTAALLINEAVDRRLTAGRIPKVTVRVNCKGRTVVCCAVRAICPQEVVLIVANAAGHPAAGDLVTFSLREGYRQLLAEQSGIVHWTAAEGDTRIVALFSGSRLDQILDHRLIDDRRKNIRYPVELQALVTTDHGPLEACIVNYSLHGLCLECRCALDLHRHYHASVICDDSIIHLSVEPQWMESTADAYLIGCDLLPHHGELLARRHASNAVRR